jgi:hypothetical protein
LNPLNPELYKRWKPAMSDNSPTNQELKSMCEDLQKQISRSLTANQDLIHARDSLDRDLARFKAMQLYSQSAIEAESLRGFVDMTVESIAKIFQVECGALLTFDITKNIVKVMAAYGLEELDG